ncbi:MAG: FAD-dependent oxidoreductase, partial [Anaerolineales bacterium]
GAPVVVNPTGARADGLRQQLGHGQRLRLLRGAHLIFAGDRFPLQQAISLLHPVDRRLLFAIPWESASLFGTTDLDLGGPMTTDLAITPSEVDYLFAALDHSFPELALGSKDVVSSFAGVRSVIDTGESDPSHESREHAIWQEDGLVTVTGGKLTIFRRMAHDVLRRIRHQLPGHPSFDPAAPILPLAATPPNTDPLPAQVSQRLVGRLGPLAGQALAQAAPSDLQPIGATPTLWAELAWAARAESVVHLEDLLLRRTRLGLLLPSGAAALHDRLRQVAQPALGWDDARWQREWQAYLALWQSYHSTPDRS